MCENPCVACYCRGIHVHVYAACENLLLNYLLLNNNLIVYCGIIFNLSQVYSIGFGDNFGWRKVSQHKFCWCLQM
jgi:hypothetical protein